MLERYDIKDLDLRGLVLAGTSFQGSDQTSLVTCQSLQPGFDSYDAMILHPRMGFLVSC